MCGFTWEKCIGDFKWTGKRVSINERKGWVLWRFWVRYQRGLGYRQSGATLAGASLNCLRRCCRQVFGAVPAGSENLSASKAEIQKTKAAARRDFCARRRAKTRIFPPNLHQFLPNFTTPLKKNDRIPRIFMKNCGIWQKKCIFIAKKLDKRLKMGYNYI